MSSFSVNAGKLSSVIAKIEAVKTRADKLTERKISKATDIIYRIARAKRPMITKQQAKAEGRRYRVSDPAAEAGVPVRTGALQASIKKDVMVKTTSVIGTITAGGQGAPYAQYVEFGTSKQTARPFMRPAILLSLAAIKAMFAKQEQL